MILTITLLISRLPSIWQLWGMYPCLFMIASDVVLHTVGSWNVVSGWWLMRLTSLPRTIMKGLRLILQRFGYLHNAPLSKRLYNNNIILSPNRRITIKKLHTIWWARVREYFWLPFSNNLLLFLCLCTADPIKTKPSSLSVDDGIEQPSTGVHTVTDTWCRK